MGSLDDVKKPVRRGPGSRELDREADEIMADLNAMLASGGAPTKNNDMPDPVVPQTPVSSAVPDVIRLDQPSMKPRGARPTGAAHPETAGQTSAAPRTANLSGPLFPEVDEPSDASSDGLEPQAEVPATAFEPPLPPEPPVDLPLMTTPDEVPPRKRRTGLKVLLAILLLLGLVYVGGAIYFRDHFLPNTTINGEEVSLVATSQVADDNSDSIKDFKVMVDADGVDLTLGASDIDASYDGDAYVESAMEQQNPWAWPLEVTGQHDIRVENRMAFDDALLTKHVGDAIDKVNKDAKKPVDAKLVEDEKTKRYEVKQEEKGTYIDKDAVLTLVRNAVNARETSVEIGEEQLLQPNVTADDTSLTAAADRINKALDATQDIVKDDKTVAKVEESEIKDWVSLGDDLSLQVDDEAITKWARGTLSEHLDTIGAKRTFNLPDGEEVSVSGGTYGWSINGEEVAEQIADNIAAGKSGKIKLSFLVEAAKWNPGGNDWGDTYIEIDLGSQDVHYFEDGETVWESPCVTGGPNIDNKDRSTPQGVYTINGNMRSGDVELKGEIDPKTNKPSYISHVKYWMPFIEDSVALHDADWRSNFGGEIYLTAGSHGCVNLPPDKAAELYDMVGEGTVVVVHG